MTPLPYVEHDCGQKIAWAEKPWALVTVGPPSSVSELLRRLRGQTCPRCDHESIPWTLEDIQNRAPAWASGYYIERSRRSWWRPWTWFREPYRHLLDDWAAGDTLPEGAERS